MRPGRGLLSPRLVLFPLRIGLCGLGCRLLNMHLAVALSLVIAAHDFTPARLLPSARNGLKLFWQV